MTMYEQAKRDVASFDRSRRLMPLLWLAVVVTVVGAAIKALRAEQVATQYGISGERAVALLRMRHSEQFGVTFPGYEWVFVDCVNSAVVNLLTGIVIGTMGALFYFGGARRRAVLAGYIEQEDRLMRERELQRLL
jgi:hypothetical protein